MKDPSANESPRDLAAKYEAKIAELRQERARLIADSKLTMSPKSLARAALGEGDGASAADRARLQERLAHIDDVVAGLVELRVEVHVETLREDLARINAEQKAIHDQFRPAGERLADCRREIQTLENLLEQQNRELSQLVGPRHLLTVEIEEIGRGRLASLDVLRERLAQL